MNENGLSVEAIEALHNDAVELVKQSTEEIVRLQETDLLSVEQEIEAQPESIAAVMAIVRQSYDSWVESDSDAPFCHILQDNIHSSPDQDVSKSLFGDTVCEMSWLDVKCLNPPQPISSNSIRTMLQTSAYDPSFRLAVSNSLSQHDWDMPKRTFRLAFDAAIHFAASWDIFLDRYTGAGIGRLLEYNDDDMDVAGKLLQSWKMEVEDAREYLAPCAEVSLLTDLIQYETAWLLYAYCGYPEPIRRSESGEVWLTCHSVTECDKGPLKVFESEKPGGKETIRSLEHEATPREPSMTPKEICSSICCNADTMSGFISSAEVTPQTRGGRPTPYKGTELKKLLRYIAKNAFKTSHKEDAVTLLEKHFSN